MTGRPHVLFITADQWRGDSLSCLGHPLVRTPHLDALAAEGVCFARHWANTAPCAPSRASLYTGTYAHHHGVLLNGTPLDARFTNVALLARTAGYAPALFGYTDSAVDPRTVAPDDPRLRNWEGVLPGFDVVVNDPDIHRTRRWGDWLARQGVDVPADPRDLYAPDPDFPGADEHGPSWNPTRFAAQHTETAFMVGELMDWLDRRSADAWRDDPFFVHLSLIRPHPPFRNPVGYHDRYDEADVGPFAGHPTPEAEAAAHPLAAAALSLPGVAAPTDERDRRQLRATYHAMQTEVDDQLGRLVDHLRRRGLYDDTLIVFTSDHGEIGGDHWLTEKLGYWDETYHVPLIVRDPRAAATRGARVAALTESVDVLPTILERIGVAIPDQCDGRSLVPFLDGDEVPTDWRDAVFWEWWFHDPEHGTTQALLGEPDERCSLAVVRTERWKYVQFATDTMPPLLFDLEADPQQLVNLADDPACAGQVVEGLRRLLQWRMRHVDRTLSSYHVTESQGLLHRGRPV